MNFYTRNLLQVATYWAPSANDGFGGKTYAAPVQVNCRWQNKRDLIRSQGKEVVSSATVYVDRELVVDGYLFLGTSTSLDPTSVEGAELILNVGASPSLQGNLMLCKVWL